MATNYTKWQQPTYTKWQQPTYTKWQQNIPNSNKICQIATNTHNKLPQIARSRNNHAQRAQLALLFLTQVFDEKIA
jgi:hypothetical protein